MKRLSLALAAGLFGLGVANAELQISAQKKLITLAGQTLTKTICAGKTMGGYYKNGNFVQEKPYSWSTLYTPKFVAISFCEKTDLNQNTELFPCDLGKAASMAWDSIAEVDVYDLVFNDEFPNGGPGDLKRGTNFVQGDIQYESTENDEDKPAIQAANDGDMSFEIIYPIVNDAPGATPGKITLKVAGVHGEDIPKRQTMKSSVECQSDKKVIPTVPKVTLTGSLMVVDGERFYVSTEKYGDVYIDANNDKKLVAQIENQVNHGMPFNFVGKVVGGNTQGYEIVLEKMTTAVPAGQPQVL